jgi:periplasmic protein TonB
MFAAKFKSPPLPKKLDERLNRAGVALNSGYMKLGKTHLQRMLIVSALVHAIVLAVKFVPDDMLKRWDKEALMVVLVNSESDTAASQAQAIANANLMGGGESDSGLVKSPLPNMQAVQDGDELNFLQQQVRVLEQQQSSLLSALKGAAQFQVVSGASQKLNPLEGAALDSKSVAIMREIAALDKQVQDYNSRPKRKHISPATREAAFAAYYALWSDRTERLGTQFYPEAAKGKFAEVMVTVSVRSDGSIEEITLEQSSGSKAIDQGALRLLKRLAPYPEFKGSLKQSVDVLDITTRLVFTPAGTLSAEMRAAAPPVAPSQ